MLRRVLTVLVALLTAVALVDPGVSLAASAATYPVMNTSEAPPDGVWFRNSPSNADTNRETGFGVYAGESLAVYCWSWGEAVGPYNNHIWYRGSDVNRPTWNGHVNSGYMNTHYVSDGMTGDHAAPEVPECGASTPPPAAPVPAGSLAQGPPAVSLAQGHAAAEGFWYAVSLRGFAPGSTVTVSCYDSASPAGFRTFGVLVNGDGAADTSSRCYSGDGPDHWVVVAGGPQSNHVRWAAAPAPVPAPALAPAPAPAPVPAPAPAPVPGTGQVGSGPQPSAPAAGTRYHGDVCQDSYGGGIENSVSIFGGSDLHFDRTASLYAVCGGFGARDGVAYSPQMKCAIIAAAFFVAGPPHSGPEASNVCDTAGVALSSNQGDWNGVVTGLGCSFFADAFATAGGVGAAGVLAETGPGAAAVGLATYKGLSAALELSCGAIFDSGAYTFGQNHEGKHETAVMQDIIHGKCLRERTVFGTIFWAAVDCSSGR